MIAEELPTTSPRTTVVTVARPLPPNWPTPTLPCAHAELLPFPAPPGLYEATAAAEEHRWTELNQKKSTPATPPSKKAGKAKKKVDSIEIRAERNQAGTLCKCGKADTEKFMLQCDGKHSMHADAICMHTNADALTKRALALSLFPYAGCDVWYHGDCVGVTQAQGMRLKSWRCKPCARRHESMQARCELYCVCRGPWDGKSFMIACDGCDMWFHGACVGLTSELSAREGAEAAFRRYHCPLCVSGATTAPAAHNNAANAAPTTPTTAAAHGGHRRAAKAARKSDPAKLAAALSARLHAAGMACIISSSSSSSASSSPAGAASLLSSSSSFSTPSTTSSTATGGCGGSSSAADALRLPPSPHAPPPPPPPPQ